MKNTFKISENNNNNKKNEIINYYILSIAIIFLIGCFIYPPILFIYPLIIITLSIININYCLQFIFLTLGINFGLFSDYSGLGPFHPNSFITIGQIIFLGIGIIKLKKLNFDKNLKFLFFFSIVSLISLVYSSDQINGLKVFANILLYIMILLYFYNKHDISIEKIFKLNIGAALISWLIIYPIQFFILKQPLFMNDLDRGLRFSAGGVHPVPLAFFMIMTFYSALFLYEKYKQKRYLVIVLISIILVVLTQTRIALVGLCLTLLVYLYYKKKMKFAIPIIVIGGLLFFQYILNFFLKKGAKYYQSGISFFSGGRVDFWRASLKSFAEKPLLGKGLGSSTTALQSYGMNVPHNDFIRILLETGLMGFVLFILFIYHQLFILAKNFRKHIIILCLFVFFIIASLTDSMIDYNLYFTFQMFVLLGLVNRQIVIENNKLKK